MRMERGLHSGFFRKVSSQSNPDSSVMEMLKTTLKIPSSVDWSESDPCRWAHVKCENNRVIRIQIPSKTVGGMLPPDLKNLSQLTVFEVMNNQISGPKPSLAGLSQLQEANFHNNNFSSLPSDFFNGLTSLNSVFLDYNPLEPWEIPESVKEATSLKTFSANKVNIKGKFPGVFDPVTFPTLTDLHLTMNNLEGELPTELGGSMIQSLWVNRQSLNGTIEVIQNMASLTEVWLHGNQVQLLVDILSIISQISLKLMFEATRRIRFVESQENKQLNGGIDEGSGRKGAWHVPTLAMTADVIHKTYDECLKCGMDGYVSKRFEEENLYQAVAKFFKAKRISDS
ncbi:receptor protein kinase TMK1-like [Durio zibethinus]|uniref:Receptor protein kinase TMK1-like n=1 Tax=Durio zibethinus TaxID=66656 RepID=A0A6P5Y5F4_DURZI|nr:receptor protein kinase TMK1-like [Durio zibethinus]